MSASRLSRDALRVLVALAVVAVALACSDSGGGQTAPVVQRQDGV